MYLLRALEDGETEPKCEHLEIGEVDGDYIGCYLMGVENSEGQPSYHSLATSKQELLEDFRKLLTPMVEWKEQLVDHSPAGIRHERDLNVIKNALTNLESFVDMYLTMGSNEPFLAMPGLHIFLRVGARKRAKVQGKYIE